MTIRRDARTLIRDALDLIKDEARWCQTDMARNAKGTGEFAWSIRATQWCALGALTKSETERANADYHARLDASSPIPSQDDSRWTNAFEEADALLAVHIPGGMLLSEFNDHPDTTHEEVIKVFKEALQ